MTFLRDRRFWLHLPTGAVNAYISLSAPMAGLTLMLGFLAYEIWQCVMTQDQAHRDIVGHLWGFALVMVAGLFWEALQ